MGEYVVAEIIIALDMSMTDISIRVYMLNSVQYDGHTFHLELISNDC